MLFLKIATFASFLSTETSPRSQDHGKIIGRGLSVTSASSLCTLGWMPHGLTGIQVEQKIPHSSRLATSWSLLQSVWGARDHYWLWRQRQKKALNVSDLSVFVCEMTILIKQWTNIISGPTFVGGVFKKHFSLPPSLNFDFWPHKFSSIKGKQQPCSLPMLPDLTRSTAFWQFDWSEDLDTQDRCIDKNLIPCCSSHSHAQRSCRQVLRFSQNDTISVWWEFHVTWSNTLCLWLFFLPSEFTNIALKAKQNVLFRIFCCCYRIISKLLRGKDGKLYRKNYQRGSWSQGILKYRHWHFQN